MLMVISSQGIEGGIYIRSIYMRFYIWDTGDFELRFIPYFIRFILIASIGFVRTLYKSELVRVDPKYPLKKSKM